jgi:hypothetical protein
MNNAEKNARNDSIKIPANQLDEKLSNAIDDLDDVEALHKEIISSNDLENLYTDLINDVLFGLIIQVHRAAKLGYLYYADTDPNLEKQLEISNEYDIFGISNSNGTHTNLSLTSNNVNINTSRNNLVKYECICPNCDRNLAAVRFAPHLEKCMGLGRNSSRIASRKIAAFNGDMYLDNFLDDDSLSIQSSSSSIDADTLAASYTYNLKPPSAKRKRLHASASMQNLTTTTAPSATTVVVPPSANGPTNNLNTSGSGTRFNFF